MRLPLLQLGWPFLFLTIACSDSNHGSGASSVGNTELADGGTGASNSDDPHAGCDAYLKCVTDAEPDALPEALQAYGPSGTCWSAGATIASDCDTACATAMGELEQAYPYITSCAGGTERNSSGDAIAVVDAGPAQSSSWPKFPGLDTTCNQCAEKSCSGTESTCLESSACETAFQCIEACNADASCDSTCSAKASGDDATALASCLNEACEGQCPQF